MDVLLIINQQLDRNEFERVQNLFSHMQVVANDNFTEVRKLVEGSNYKLIVFMTFEDNFPSSWKMGELKINTPIMTLLKINKLDLFVFYSFLDSVGLLSKPASSKSANSEIHPLLYQSLTFIEENIHENDLSLEMVASSIYVSRCHYSRLFKEHFGTGFKEYIMNKRIQKAKVMLQEGQPVTDVCYAVGYGDLTHFGRVFKKLVGINPSVYRKQKGIKTNTG